MTHAPETNRNHYDKTQVTSPKEVLIPQRNIKCLKEFEAMGDFLLSNIWPTSSNNVLITVVSTLN